MTEDRIKESCTITGTGDITLTGALTAYKSFGAVYANASVITYCIVNDTDSTWEVGYGVYNSIPNTISRTTVKSNSSNNTSLISFAAGTKYIFNDISSAQFSTTGGIKRYIPVGRTTGDSRDGTIDPLWLPYLTIDETNGGKFGYNASKGVVTAVSSTSTTTLDCNLSNCFEVTLTGNSHNIVTTNSSVGQLISIKVLYSGHTGLTFGDTTNYNQSRLLPSSGDITTIVLLCFDSGPTWTEVGRNTSIAGMYIDTQSGTTYTIGLIDIEGYLRCTGSSAVTITIPTNATTAFPIGTEIVIMQAGTGKVSPSAAGGVTLNIPSGVTGTALQWAAFTLKKVDTNIWDCFGQLA